MAATGNIVCFLTILLTLTFISYSNGQFTTWADYNNSWYREHPLYAAKMYPFGTRFGDKQSAEIETLRGLNPQINFIIPFYSQKYTAAYIAPSGHISLWPRTANISVFTETYLPNPRYPFHEGAPAYDDTLVAVFYTGVSVETQEARAAKLYHRLIVNPQQEIDREMLKMMTDHVKQGIAGSNSFQATRALVVTWYKYTFEGTICQAGGPACNRNTYQAVVLTDERETFTIFNYYNITWIGSVKMGCDAATGAGAGCNPAQVGFNRGHVRGFFDVPFSKKAEIANVDDYDGGLGKGRFVFKISGDKPVQGGCMDSSTGISWPLQLNPAKGVMYGGTAVYLSGPCFTQSMNIMCRFGIDGPVVNGTVLGNTKAKCIAPFMTRSGEITLSLSTDGGTNYQYSAKYFLVSPELWMPTVQVHNDQKKYHELNPASLSMSWNPAHFGTQDNTTLVIQLLGYREEGDQAHHEILHTFTDNLNSGGSTYEFNPADHQCTGAKCDQYTMGMIRISPKAAVDRDPGNPWRLTSKVIPLGWFIRSDMESRHGSGWAQAKCNSWERQDRTTSQWKDGIPACPCSLYQTYGDFGRWMADPGCDIKKAGMSGNCGFHEGAVHCVRSQPTPEHGSGSQCCYNGEGNLMYAQDSIGGSTADRAHVMGLMPHNKPPHVPTLSHWHHDVVPFFLCCVWSSGKCFENYLRLRPTADCKGYQAARTGAVYGDPHFQTFAGTRYTFNGKGEYFLLHITEPQPFQMKAAARLQQPENNGNATKMTAIAMEEINGTTSGKIHIGRTAMGESKKLVIRVNGTIREFTEPHQRYVDFNGVKIINNNGINDTSQSNITVMFKSGIGVQVANPSGSALHAFIAVPHDKFKDKTSGLFGVNSDIGGSGNSSGDSDLRAPGGQTIQPDPSNGFRRLYTEFGDKWRTGSTENLLYYPNPKMNYNYFNDLSFSPQFGMPSGSWQTVCGNDEQCGYDYLLTNNRLLAENTKSANEWVAQIAEFNKASNSCGLLNVPMSIKDSSNYNLGSTVVVTGCRAGYSLGGHTSYTCQMHGGSPQWRPPLSATCSAAAAPNQAVLAAAISVPIVLIIVIVVVVLVVIIVMRRRKRAREEEKPSSPPSTQVEYEKQPNVEMSPQTWDNTNYPQGGYPEGPGMINPALQGSRTSLGKQSLTGAGAGVPDVNMKPAYRSSQDELYPQQQQPPYMTSHDPGDIHQRPPNYNDQGEPHPLYTEIRKPRPQYPYTGNPGTASSV